MQKTVFLYKPTDEELKAIEESWNDGYEEEKQYIMDSLIKMCVKKIENDFKKLNFNLGIPKSE